VYTDPSGELVPLTGDIRAFLPALLPPRLEPTWDLLRKAEAAHGAVSELAGQARLIENVEFVVKALSRREAVASSRMEGTQTEIVDVLLHEASGSPLPAEDSDLYEVLNYLATIDLAREWIANGRTFGIGLINDLHRRLMQGVRGDDKSPGHFRRRNVYIGTRSGGFAGARFIPPPLEHVAGLMENLAEFVRDHDAYGPILSAAIAHYQFETIHPYEDGNGRLGRLLIPIQLMFAGVIDRPVLYVAPALERADNTYRDLMLAVSQRSDWNAWLVFFADAVRETADDALRRVSGLLELLADYRARVQAHSSSRYALPAVDLLFRRVIISPPVVVRELGATGPTARAIIEELARLGLVRRYSRVGNTQMWIADAVLEHIYAD